MRKASVTPAPDVLRGHDCRDQVWGMWGALVQLPAQASRLRLRGRGRSKTSFSCAERDSLLHRSQEVTLDISRAHAVLGVEPETPLDEVKRRYRMRAQMLHPDRQVERPELANEAARAMSELNEAWNVISSAENDGTRGRAPGMSRVDSEDNRRLPFEGECDMCGSAPARRVTLRSITGLILLWRSRKTSLDLCRTCGTSAFREIQSETLIKGWWGIIAIYANVVVALMNVFAWRGHQTGLPAPQRRDPDVVAPFPPGLGLAGPVFKRPPVLLASGAAIIGYALLITAGSANDNSTPDPTAPIRDSGSSIGTCLDVNGGIADCSGPAARYQITEQVPAASYCGYLEVFTDSEGHVYCARVVP